MAYELNLIKNNSVVWMTIQEPVSYGEVISHLDVIQQLGRQRAIQNFIIDVRDMPYVSSLLSQYQLAYEDLPERDWPQTWKITLLSNSEDATYDFLETVGQNAGYPIRVMSSEQAAMNWLDC